MTTYKPDPQRRLRNDGDDIANLVIDQDAYIRTGPFQTSEEAWRWIDAYCDRFPGLIVMTLPPHTEVTVLPVR